MSKKIVDAAILGCVFGVLLSLIGIVDKEVAMHFVWAMVYLVASVLFLIWNIKAHILFAALVIFIMVQIIKIRAGFNTRRN